MRACGELFELGNVVVPFDQGGHRPELAHGIFIKRPDLLADWLIMRVDLMCFTIGMAGQMKLDNAFGRDLLNKLARLEIMIECRDKDIVDVEQ